MSCRVSTNWVRHYSHVTESFPRLQARTHRFTLGSPSHVSISADGRRLAYLQSTGPTDAVKRLLIADLDDSDQQLAVSESGRPQAALPVLDPRVVADPAALIADEEQLSHRERARRERLREAGGGIVSFSADDSLSTAVFALSSCLGVATIGSETSSCHLHEVAGPVIDPRVDAAGSQVAWVADGELWVSDIGITNPRRLLATEGDHHTWGMANFLAAEEFDRVRGFWWSPDSTHLLVEEVDASEVAEWTISDPSQPWRDAHIVRYPVVGGINPTVRLWLVNVSDGSRRLVWWDHTEWEYLVSVRWTAYGPPLVTLFDRLQRNAVVLAVDPAKATTTIVHRASDEAWVSMIPGTPTWNCDGSLITTRQIGDVETIAIGSTAIDLPPGWQVSGVDSVSPRGVLLSMQPTPTRHAMAIVTDGQVRAVGPVDRWSTGVMHGDTVYIAATTATTATWDRVVYRINRDEGAVSIRDQALGAVSLQPIGEIASHAMVPPITIAPNLVTLGERSLNAAILWPKDHVPGSRKLPVVMNPYGGPHAQRVLEFGRMFTQAQWVADQGFCVVIADGRGSPGRGPRWERTINGDLASLPLADQVDAMAAVAERWPDDVDPARVGITGWSFGGYLAALAVLRRPDIFKAAVAGAPVTDWRWYDSAYTERYLGDPATDADNYEASSLIPLAPSLQRALMIIHGFADDNVVVAHSLQLSSALTAAGRPHTFVPLANVTHMTPQEEVAENLLRLEVDFFRRHL